MKLNKGFPAAIRLIYRYCIAALKMYFEKVLAVHICFSEKLFSIFD